MGRKSWEPTQKDREEITALIGMGLTAEQVATLKGICRDTLYRYCKAEIDKGRPRAIAQVAKTAFQMAVSGQFPAMTMFWLKTQAKWREKDPEDATDQAAGSPVYQSIYQTSELNPSPDGDPQG